MTTMWVLPLQFVPLLSHLPSTARVNTPPSAPPPATPTSCYDRFSSPVGMENRRGFGGRRDLDCSAPRVWWLRTPLRGKAEAQGSRPSKPEKKGTRPIGNSRGIAVRVGRLLLGSGKALDTFLCPLHESGLVEGERM